MKALQLSALGRLELVDIMRPQIAADEVLVQTRASTICTSDIQDVRANPFAIALPVIIGHEGAGVVAAVGDEVHDIAVGDHIAAHPVHSCGRCATCRDGKPHLCLDMGHFGLNMQGTFAPFFLARADRVRRIPFDLDFATGALLEPVCVCLEALHQARLRRNQSLLIVGDGPFGVIMARLAATFFAQHVVLAGHEDFRLGFAPSAVQVNTRTTPDYRTQLQSYAPTGYDAAIVAVAAADAVDDAVALVRAMGRVVLFAPLPGKTPVDLFTVLLKELELVGSVNDQERMNEALQLLADPELKLGELVTHRFALDEYHAAFELAEHGLGAAMKVAITFPDSEHPAAAKGPPDENH